MPLQVYLAYLCTGIIDTEHCRATKFYCALCSILDQIKGRIEKGSEPMLGGNGVHTREHTRTQ